MSARLSSTIAQRRHSERREAKGRRFDRNRDGNCIKQAPLSQILFSALLSLYDYVTQSSPTKWHLCRGQFQFCMKHVMNENTPAPRRRRTTICWRGENTQCTGRCYPFVPSQKSSVPKHETLRGFLDRRAAPAASGAQLGAGTAGTAWEYYTLSLLLGNALGKGGCRALGGGFSSGGRAY